LIEPVVLRAGAVDRFQLEESGPRGELGIWAELENLLLMCRQSGVVRYSVVLRVVTVQVLVQALHDVGDGEDARASAAVP